MITMENLIKEIKGIDKNEELDIFTTDTEISITIEDFEGFDEDWNECFRNVEINVNGLIKLLREKSISYEEDFYSTYNFNGYKVELGYSSYDI